MIVEDYPIGYIPEVTITFNDGSSYTVRPNGIGDTIFGDFAHKIMYELDNKERAHNSSSVYRFSMNDKITWIIKNSETI